MKAGLSLIELMIGLFIASLVAVGLYNTFFLTGRITEKADITMNISRTIAIISNQFEKDLSAIVLPATESGQKQQKEKETLSPEKFLTVTLKNENVESLTFLTNNPLAAFQTGQLIQKRRPVRVMYRLVPDEQPDSFKLLRQESTNLDVKTFDLKENKVRPFQMMRNIRSMTIQWPLKNEKDSSKPFYQFIIITLDVWNNALHERSTPVTMNYVMPSFADVARQLEQAKKEQEKKAAAEKSEAQTKKNEATPQVPATSALEQKAKATIKSAQSYDTVNQVNDIVHIMITNVDAA